MLQEWFGPIVGIVAVVAFVAGAAALALYRSMKERRRRRTAWSERPYSFSSEQQYDGSTLAEVSKWLHMLEERVTSISDFTRRLQSRIEKLENELRSASFPESRAWTPPVPTVAPPEHTFLGPPMGVEPGAAKVVLPSQPYTYEARPSPSDVAAEILSELNARGGASEVARLSGLKTWVSRRAPHVRAEPIHSSGDFWLLIVITTDLKEGIVIPTLDTVVGPGEVFKWFDCTRYDGTQPLKRTDVVSPAEALRDPSGNGWLLARKGRIDRTRREGGA